MEEYTNCCVCDDGEWTEGDPIVFCDGCDMGTHVQCYGAPLIYGIPHDEWYCENCKHNARDAKCILCPNKGGAMKRTTDGRWAHISCALWIPEVFFLDPDSRDMIDIFKIAERRWNYKCIYCNKVEGCCIECSEPKCTAKFHVTCGISKKVLLEYKPSTTPGHPDIICAYCTEHAEAARKKSNWKMKYVINK
ncbi:hypothetical protein WA158_007920 [Blastocystis sp. Blastoise]